MPLPSSSSRNKVGAALSNPTINLANYTPDPTAISNSVIQGANVANTIGDNLILRPKQVAAAQALANAQKEAADTSSTASVAERSLIPLRAQGEAQNIPLRSKEEATRLGAQTTGNETEQLLAAVKKTVAENPAFADSLRKTIVTQQQTNEAVAGRGKVLAQGAEKSAPQEAQTNQYNVSAENSAAEDKATAAAQDATHEANVSALTNSAIANAGAARVQAAPFKNPNTAAALDEGANAGAVAGALGQKINLANTIASGMAGGTALTPENRQKILDQALQKGVPIMDAGGAMRPLPDIQREMTQKINLEGSEKVLEGVRKDSAQAQQNLQLYQNISGLVNGQAATGGLRSLPGAAVIDSVLAGWGNRSSQANQQLSAYQGMLTLGVKGDNFGGRLTDTDIALLKGTVPGVEKAKTVNKELITTGVLLNQRDAQKSDFYEQVIPSLGAAGADRLWNQYIQSNPILDPKQSRAGQLVVNRSVMTPVQYLEAVQNPAQAVQQMQQTTDTSTVPIFNPVNPSNSPFVKDQKSGSVFPNPVFWTPIQTAHQKFFPASASPANNDYSVRIQRLVTTPVDDLIRPRQ